MTPAEVAEHGSAGHVMTTHGLEIVCVTCTVKDRFRLFMLRPVQIDGHEIIPWAIVPGSGTRMSESELALYRELMEEIVSEELAQETATIRILYVPVNDALPVVTKTVTRDYETFRALVGNGWLEVTAPLDNAWTLWVDEDGISKDLPLNHRATRFAHASGWNAPTDYHILGPAFFTGPADGQGETLAVPESLIATAEAFFSGDYVSE